MEVLCKILPWTKNTKSLPKYSVDIKDENTYFTILDGKYQNITITYSQAQFFEDEGFARLKFNYNIIDSLLYTEEQLTNDQDFVIILGDILQDYILIKANNLESVRERNSEEFDFQ
jgi:NDP-sugar pyrophosphorylase family protein